MRGTTSKVSIIQTRRRVLGTLKREARRDAGRQRCSGARAAGPRPARTCWHVCVLLPAASGCDLMPDICTHHGAPRQLLPSHCARLRTRARRDILMHSTVNFRDAGACLTTTTYSRSRPNYFTPLRTTMCYSFLVRGADGCSLRLTVTHDCVRRLTTTP